MGIDDVPKPSVSSDITLGSLLSMITTIIATAGIVYSTGAVVAELRGKDMLHEDRLSRIESRLLKQDSDHDLLIQISRDVQRLNERLMRADLSGRSVPN